MVKDESWHCEKQKLVESYRKQNKEIERGGIVFAGSSLMEFFPVESWCAKAGLTVYNRGIAGYTIGEYLEVLDILTELMPSKIFINIGSNDLGMDGKELPDWLSDYERLVRKLEQKVPAVNIYFMAYYPVNPDTDNDFMRDQLLVRTNELIGKANDMIRQMAEEHGQRFIDVGNPLRDSLGRLRKEYSIDGVHMTVDAYRAVFPAVLKYVCES